MNQPTFITLLGVGVIVGVVEMLVGRGPKLPHPFNLGVSTTRAFFARWVLSQINPAAIQEGFALGGSVTLLLLNRTLKK